MGEDAPANAVPSLENGDAPPGAGKQLGSGEASYTGSYDQHIGGKVHD